MENNLKTERFLYFLNSSDMECFCATLLTAVMTRRPAPRPSAKNLNNLLQYETLPTVQYQFSRLFVL